MRFWNRSIASLAILFSVITGCRDPEIDNIARVGFGDWGGSGVDANEGSGADASTTTDAPELCQPEAIACPVLDEPQPVEYITCSDLIAGWAFSPSEIPDELWGASGYSSYEIASHQPNDWFTPMPVDPTPTCCKPGEIVYSYSRVGEITCNPPWATSLGELNDSAVTFGIWIDTSRVCGQCDPITPPARPPIIAMQMDRPAGPLFAAMPPQNPPNKPVPVPQGTKPQLPPKKVVPATDPIAPTETGTPKAALAGIANKPAFTRKPINTTNIGTANADYNLGGHDVQATFYSGNGAKRPDGKVNAVWNREQAEAHADSNTDLPNKKIAINIRQMKEFDQINAADTPNRTDAGGPKTVEIDGKRYLMSPLSKDESVKLWRDTSASYAKTFGNYVDRAQKPGVAKCWLEGSMETGAFYNAEWPILKELWEARFADGPFKGQRKISIEYFQGGKWVTYDGTNPPTFAKPN